MQAWASKKGSATLTIFLPFALTKIYPSVLELFTEHVQSDKCEAKQECSGKLSLQDFFDLGHF